LTAAEKARISRIYMIEEGLAAALGSGIAIDDDHAVALLISAVVQQMWPL
jgi:actin-like ATPase involved in cell morphogenesis